MNPRKEQCIIEYGGIWGDVKRYMTVAQVIAELQKLEQDKYIYVEYDGGCYVFCTAAG